MKRQFLLVFLAWLGVCLLGALPYYFSGYIPVFTNAFFESVSGFTTTGVTVLVDIESLPAWLLFWRSISQWLGGMGGITLGAVFLSLFAAGGFQLKKLEYFGSNRTVRAIFLIYIGLTAFLSLLLAACGMGWFDAVTHAFSVMSTGGFSIRSGGIAAYHSPAIEWVCTVFMFLAGLSFSFIWLLLWRKPVSVTRSSEAGVYAGIVVITAIVIMIAILPQSLSFGTAARRAFFQVTSLISTCGLSGTDYNLWPAAAQGALFFLLFIGGCSGSAAGGIKVIRYVILSKQTWNEIKRLVYPRGIFNIQLDGKSGDKKAVHGAAGFVFLYFVVIFAAAMLVSSSDAGVFTSLNTALVCLGNIGRGLGDMGVFRAFPAYVKWGLCLVMIMGRLELWMVLVLFTV
jgi:trk system potassium uptake protein TrkH